LIFEPDDPRRLSRAAIVFPDQCQDLCKRSSYGDSPRAPFQCFLDRSRGGHTIPRDRYSSLYDVCVCSARLSKETQKERTNKVVVRYSQECTSFCRSRHLHFVQLTAATMATT